MSAVSYATVAALTLSLGAGGAWVVTSAQAGAWTRERTRSSTGHL